MNYRFDEVVLTLQGVKTAEEIEEDFENWWSRGLNPEKEKKPEEHESKEELEKRVEMLEECLLELSGLVYA